jgi:hypothetical protein
MPPSAPPYQFIAIARTIARGFTAQATGHPRGRRAGRGRASDLARGRGVGGDGTAQASGRSALHEFRAPGAVGDADSPSCLRRLIRSGRSCRAVADRGTPCCASKGGSSRHGMRSDECAKAIRPAEDTLACTRQTRPRGRKGEEPEVWTQAETPPASEA